MRKSDAVQDEINGLRAMVLELQERLHRLEGGADSNGGARSRRDLLKLVGAAAVGAAGSVVLRATPAEALDGNSVVLGNTDPAVNKTNDAAFPTTMTPTAPDPNPTGVPTPLLKVTGPNHAAPPVPALPNTPGFLFFAPIQGFGGVVPQSDGSMPAQTFNFAEGVDGYAGGVAGTGVAGSSDAGIGVAGASISGVDLFALGNGTFGQLPFTAGGGASPGYLTAVNDLELVREADGSLWASRAHFVNGTGAVPTGIGPDTWKRMNTVRVDSDAGDGSVFAPVRLIDTRAPATNGGHPGPLANNQSYDFGPFTGTNGIPSDAVGIVGNLTAVAAAPFPSQFAAQGYLAIYPKGFVRTASSPSNVNFGGPVYAWPNSFTVGFGSGTNAGSFSIFVFGTPVHVIVDVFAYIQ